MFAFPSSLGGLESENANNVISIDKNDMQKINASTYKKVYYKKWYKSGGRWKYYWKYKYVKISSTVKSPSKTSNTSNYKTSSTDSNKTTTTKYKKVRYKQYYKQWYKSKGRWKYYLKYRWAIKYVKLTSKTASTVKSTVNNTPDPSNKYGARDVKVTENYVQCSGRCTCSLYEDYDYHTSKFVNYCPYCHKKGLLDYEEGTVVSSSGKVYNNPEGMWVCSTKKGGCDADFCLVHGKAHVTTGAKYLTPA
ncbi:MAG: hypothetical protein QME14_02705 [Methanobacteriaceae archaeon]|nr:hypothetical protein [Methanobacteriaceae archaeon]